MRPMMLLAALSASLAATAQIKPITPGNTLLAGEFAYFLAPPRMVVDDYVDHFTLAPGGRYALIWGSSLPSNTFSTLVDEIATGKPPEPAKPVLKIWDVDNDKVTSVVAEPGKPVPAVWKLAWSSVPGVAYQVGMLPGVVETGNDPTNPRFASQLLKLNLADGTFKPIVMESSTARDEGRVFCSPTKPIMVVVRSVQKRQVDSGKQFTTAEVRVYDLDGKELQRSDTDQPGYLSFGNDWLLDGTHLVGTLTWPGAGQDGTLKSTVVLDTTTATVTVTSESLTMYKAPTVGLPMILTTSKVVVVQGKTELGLFGLWLESAKTEDQSQVLVAAEVSSGKLMPDLGHVLYTARNRLYSCEIAKMDKADYLTMIAAEERAKALGKAKEVGVGLSIYGQDHEGSLPGQGNFKDEVQPYLRNNGVLEGFTYTFKGGDLSGIKNPAGTEIGYVSVNGGRCVLYADFHSGFVKD